jgi:hypothetical protein
MACGAPYTAQNFQNKRKLYTLVKLDVYGSFILDDYGLNFKVNLHWQSFLVKLMVPVTQDRLLYFS